MATKASSYIPKDPKTYLRAGIAAGVTFFVLNSIGNRVPAVDKVRSAVFKGL